MNEQINVSMNGQRFKRTNVGRNDCRIFQPDVPKTIRMLELSNSGTLEYRSVGILNRIFIHRYSPLNAGINIKTNKETVKGLIDRNV